MQKRDGAIIGVVEIDFLEVVESNIEELDDLFEERLIAGGCISNIGYRVIGVGRKNVLHIEVVADWEPQDREEQ